MATVAFIVIVQRDVTLRIISRVVSRRLIQFISAMNDPRNKTMPEMMDRFADDHSLIEEYVFNGIASFY